MQHRRVGLCRLYRIKQRFQLFIFDIDQFQRLLRRNLRLRRDRRDFFADEPHHAIGQHRRIVDTPADTQSGHVLTGNHRFYPRHLPSFAGVDAFDPSVWDRTAQASAP